MRTWGAFLIEDADGRDLTPRGRKSRAVIAVLASRRGQPVTRDSIAELLWGDRAEEQAKASLRQSLSELRPLTHGAGPVLEADRRSLMLRSDTIQDSADRAASLGSRADMQGVLDLLNDGAEWLADLGGLSSEFDLWLAAERGQGRERLIQSVLAACGKNSDDPVMTAKLARRLLTIDPCNESAARLAIESLAAQGDVAASEREFQQLSRVLQTELGISPSASTLEARRSALARVTEGPTPRQAAPPPAVLTELNWKKATAAALLLGGLVFGGLRYVDSEPIGAAAILPTAPLAVVHFGESSEAQEALAKGISEEVRARLRDYSSVNVLGPVTSSQLAAAGSDHVVAARNAGITFLIRGRFTATEDRLRFDVTLTRTAGRPSSWARRFEGDRDDLFETVDVLAQTLAVQMGAVDNQSAAIQRPISTRSEIYAGYLTALSLIRDREPAKMDRAIAMLRSATREDPDFALAWAALGRALMLRANNWLPDEAAEMVRPEALQYARRAAQLAPDLAEVYLALGTTAPTGHSTPYFQRSADLDPSEPEVWNALGQDYELRGEYPRAFHAWRQAFAVDPLWWRAHYNAARIASEFGRLQEADNYLRLAAVGASGDPFQLRLIESDRALYRGDIAAAIQARRLAVAAADPGRLPLAHFALGRILKSTGNHVEAAELWGADRELVRMWGGNAPAQAEVRAMIATPGVWTDEPRIDLLLRTLSREGRSSEIAALFDARFAAPEILVEGHPVSHAAMVRDSALVARALRDLGREEEARRIFRLASRQVSRVLRKGPAPRSYLYHCAGLAAAMGDREKALRLLAAAAARGWRYGDDTSFRDISEEPLMRPLLDLPAFGRLRSTLRRI